MRKTLLAAAIAVASASASAAVIGDSFNNASQITEINQTGTLDLFDSNLGTLNSVTLTLDGSALTTFTLTNRAAQTQNARFTGTVDLLFSSNLAGLNLGGAIINLSMSTGIRAFPPDTPVVLADIPASDSIALSPSPALFAVAGGGTFTINCTSLSGLGVVGGGGNIDAVQDTTARCGAAVSYDFTPTPPPPPPNNVPEPGLLALAGIAALVGTRRLRRAR